MEKLGYAHTWSQTISHSNFTLSYKLTTAIILLKVQAVQPNFFYSTQDRTSVNLIIDIVN